MAVKRLGSACGLFHEAAIPPGQSDNGHCSHGELGIVEFDLKFVTRSTGGMINLEEYLVSL